MTFPQSIYPCYAAASGFSPASLNPVHWYDFTDPTVLFQEITGGSATTPAGVGNLVGTIRNKGSAGGYAQAPTTGARCTLIQQGTYTAVQGAINLYYTITTGYSMATGGASTIYHSFYRASTTQYSANFGNETGASAYPSWQLNSATPEAYIYLGGSFMDVVSGMPANTVAGHVMTTRQNAANTLDFFYDNTQVLTASANTPSCTLINVFHPDSGANNYNISPAFAVLIFNSAHTGTDLSNMKTYMGALAGIVL